jgi:hypothetical protein
MRRPRKLGIVQAAALLGALAAGNGAFADVLRCGNRVIARGDHVAKLLRYCGEPVAVQSWVAERGVVGFGTVFRPGFGFVEEVLVEEWTYNFGPRKLMRQIRLENGRVRQVELLGYGYRED